MLVGCCYFAPGASRVSPRRATYFFCFAKKSKQKKASHVRAASRSLALLAAFGTLANSLRSDNASVFIRTLLRCSARPNGGGIPHGSSASRTSPRLLVRFANLAPVARSLRSPRGGWVASFLTPHFSQGHGTPCRYSLQRQRQNPKLRHSARSRGIHVPLHSNLDAATTRSMTACSGHRYPHHPHHSPSFPTPHSSLLTPHSSPLTPHSSLLTPHPSLLPPHPSLLPPHPSPLTPPSSLLPPHSSLLTPPSSLLPPHSSLLTPHSSLLTPHSSLLTPHSSPLTPPEVVSNFKKPSALGFSKAQG